MPSGECRIEHLIKLRLYHLENKGAKDRLFGKYGPLSTFNNRLLFAFHLGWLSKKEMERLNAFRNIRNAFAHRAFQISFDDAEIQNQMKRIDYDIETFFATVGPELGEYKSLDARSKTLCKFAFLAERTFRDLIVLPVAIALQVNPNDICKSYGDGPEKIREVSCDVADAVIVTAKGPPLD